MAKTWATVERQPVVLGRGEVHGVHIADGLAVGTREVGVSSRPEREQRATPQRWHT